PSSASFGSFAAKATTSSRGCASPGSSPISAEAPRRSNRGSRDGRSPSNRIGSTTQTGWLRPSPGLRRCSTGTPPRCSGVAISKGWAERGRPPPNHRGPPHPSTLRSENWTSRPGAERPIGALRTGSRPVANLLLGRTRREFRRRRRRGVRTQGENAASGSHRYAEHGKQRKAEAEDARREQQREDRYRGHEHRREHKADAVDGPEVHQRGEEEAREPGRGERSERERRDVKDPAPFTGDERGDDEAHYRRRKHRLRHDRGRGGGLPGPRGEDEVECGHHGYACDCEPPHIGDGGEALSAKDGHRSAQKARDETRDEEGGADLLAVEPYEPRGEDRGRDHVSDQCEKGRIDRTGEKGGREDRQLHSHQERDADVRIGRTPYTPERRGVPLNERERRVCAPSEHERIDD